jgi:autotransporter-associated beta strand protein
MHDAAKSGEIYSFCPKNSKRDPKRHGFLSSFAWYVCLVAGFFALPAARADQIKANNDNNLELGSSWVSAIAPGGNDNAIWNSTVATPADCTNTLGAAVIWSGIVVSNPSAPVVINGASTTLTIGNGINLNSATVDLVVNCGTINLGTSQTWTVPSGRTLTTGSLTSSGAVNSPNNGNYTVTKNGSGTWTTSGTGDNGSTGVTVGGGTFNLNKTSSGGAHAVGGPGLQINSGGTARITGPGGDQIYDGGSVTLSAGAVLDLYGNSETIATLAGTGGVVDNTAAGKSATLTLATGSSTFSGTLQNSGAGATLALVKNGTGTFTLNGVNTYSGGTTVAAGTLALTSGANAAMAYTVSGGILEVSAAVNGVSLPMTGLTVGGGASQLTFNLGGLRNLSAPLVNDNGNLIINGSVPVNVTSVAQSGTYVLLQYNGTRSGTRAFVAGTLPSGASLTDNAVTRQLTLTYVSPFEPQVVIPNLNTNEVVVAVATPQQYGAVGDGITDDTAAFQNAMNAVYNSGGFGGGVVYVPAGNYAFYTNLNIPTGVTLHGDWQDWTKSGGGLAGTTFKVYFGAGQTNARPFITLSGSTALRDVNIWYPNQNAASIMGYPFSIGVNDDCVVQNVVLLNSYQGIETYNGGSKHILSTIIGSPLYKGIDLDQIFDVCHAEDVRFSPNVWANSEVTNAPVLGGPQATWMRANGEGVRLRRVDGEMCMDTFISGYNVGIEANSATNGQPGVTFYSGVVSNCAVALLAQDMPSAFGLMFANFTLDGDVAISRTNALDDANAMFDHCQIIGRNGPAVNSIGYDWHSWMQFQNCTISNALQLTGPGVFNVVDSALLGGTQCVLAANATRAAFTGCTFGPATNLVNNGNRSNLLVDARSSVPNALPIVYWTNVVNNYLSRHAARTNLYVVTDVPWDAYGNGSNDDTAAIQAALEAAGANGGGIVYLPAGKYHLTNTLDVPAGVELRGAFEMRHGTSPGPDGHAKGSILEPYGGQGTTNGPAAVALETGGGLVGFTISYESQSSNCIPFPATIQGRGANVYAIGICCPNPYAFVDLDSYPCTNHFLDMVDGWALQSGYTIGNGSSGTVVDCHDNWTYWVENNDSQSSLPGNVQAPVLSYVSHNLQMYVLGNCTEQMVKDFSIIEKTFVDCITEGGNGPKVTLINNYCDASIQGFVLEAASPASTITAVNMPMTTFNFGGYSDQAEATVAVLSTTNFQGIARFTSSVLWGGTWLDFVVNGGDVGFDMAHMDNHSFIGSVVNGGVFHLINNSAYITYNGTSNFPPYNVAFNAGSGLPGRTNEFIGCYAYNGGSGVNASVNSPAEEWNDYALSAYALFNPSLPVIYNMYPNGNNLFEYTNALSFAAAATAGIATNHITVILNGSRATNLIFQGSAVNWNVTSPGLALNTADTATITVTDNLGQIISTTVNFDTFSPNNYSFEAEDFDYTGSPGNGLFIDNPQTDAYAGLSGTAGIDYYSINSGQGGSAYRPNTAGLETEGASDLPRPAYNGGLPDYDVGYNSTGNWGNYTRTYPAGAYYIYLRAADGISASGDSASMYLVTSGQHSTNQIVRRLGTFSVPATGNWQVYTWVPLENSSGSFAVITNTGLVQTLRVMTDNGNYNANFYQLAPTTTGVSILGLAAVLNGQGATLSFRTLAGYNYQVEYKDNLTDANWTPLGSAISGNGSIQSLSDTPDPSQRFYRVQIQ